MLRGVPVVLLVGLCTIATAQKKPATSGLTAQAQPAVASDSGGFARLTVRRVVLYKNGIGYFEHTTASTGTRNWASISRPPS